MPKFVERPTAQAFGDILKSPEGAFIRGGIISSTARDAGSSPTTLLRDGLVLSQLTASKEWKEFGANLVLETNESVGTGNGTKTVFGLAFERVLPDSETITVGGTAVPRSAYALDYYSGIITFKTAPANGAAIAATYLHVRKEGGAYVFDGTETPKAVLLNPVSLVGSDGSVVSAVGDLILAGEIDITKIKVASSRSLSYATKYLSRHGFIGISDLDF